MTQSGNVRNAGTGKIPLGQRTVTVTLSLPRAAVLSAFGLFAVVWVFIFGIMLGRGYNPEETVPALAGLMPAEQPPVPAAAVEPDVIPAQDLQYRESLQPSRTTRPAPPARRDAPSTPAAPPAVEPARQSSRPAQTAEPRRDDRASTPDPRRAESPAATSRPESQDRTVYDYVYQVAASNNPTAAEQLRKKLEKGGLRATINQSEANGVIWHRIMVSFRGRAEDTRTLRANLTALGIKDVILRGKTPVR